MGAHCSRTTLELCPWWAQFPGLGRRVWIRQWLMTQATDLALTVDERAALLALIAKMGERAVLAELHVSRQALGRTLAGLGVRRGTVALARAGLASPNLQAELKNSDVTKSRRDPSHGGRA